MIIKCSNCNKGILEVTSRNTGFTKRLVVQCPFCSDKSYEQEIGNQYSLFPLDGVDMLDLIDPDIENCRVIIQTSKIQGT